jgi:DeoR/GlpR family transcriptional regulator of sugar metabolism
MSGNIRRIKDFLLSEKRASVSELKSLLSVSEVTVRKLLAQLEEEGFLLRRYGGAVIAENPEQVRNILNKMDTAGKEKRAIARVCSNLIKEKENIILDAGSTTLAIAREIRGRKVRIVTNSLAIANELSSPDSEATIEILGGSLRKQSASIIGPQVCRALEKIRVDKAFIGCSGFDPELGFSSENAIEADTKRMMLRAAAKKIIVCDHNKFERPAFANFANPEEVDVIVSDKKPNQEVMKIFREHKIEVIIAK